MTWRFSWALGLIVAVIGGMSLATDPPPPPALSLAREPAFNPAAPLLGRVRLLDADGIVLHQWTSPQPNDLFGLSAILLPDVNGDGVGDVAIGAPNAFDDVAGARVGTVVIQSGADGSTITTISGTPLERFGLALFGASVDNAAVVTVLVQHLDQATGQPITPGGYTFQSFNAFSGALVTEAVQAPDGFTAQAAEDSLAIYIRAAGPADLNASGEVTPSDFTILANNFGATVDPITGQLLANDPTLAATPVGDTNGDGVVDGQDVAAVAGSMGQNFEIENDPLTEAEAMAVEFAFAQATPMRAECHPCWQCPPERCLRMVQPFGEPLEPETPEFDDGDEDVGEPEDGGEPDGGNGGGDPGGDPDPDGDDDGDGIPNKDDCDSSAFSAGGGGGNCSAPCGDSDGDGTRNQDDCGSECYQGDPADCDCRVTIEGCPTPDGLPANGVSPTEVIILPDDPAQGATVTLTATGDPGGGTYQWVVVGAATGPTDQPTITLTVTNPGEVVASVTYTTDVDGQQCLARDRCVFLAWRCVIEPTEMVVCLEDPPFPTEIAFASENAPEAEVRWTVVNGQDYVNPDAAEGSSFLITPEEPGEVTVKCELLRDGVPKCDSEVTLTIPGPLCGPDTVVAPSYFPAQGDWDCGGDNFGQVKIDAVTVQVDACMRAVDLGRWELVVITVESRYEYSLCLKNRIDISGAYDPDVTAISYCDILADIAPTGRCASYTSLGCSEQHENTHVAEWKSTLDTLWQEYEIRIEAITAQCGSDVSTAAEAVDKLDSQLRALLAEFNAEAIENCPSHANGRTLADQVTANCLAGLSAEIRQRAVAEGWTPCAP